MRNTTRFGAVAMMLALALSLVVLPGCGTSSRSDNEQTAFTTKEVPLFRETATDETIALRFYDDQPNVAYVDVADFFRLLFPSGSVDVTAQEDDKFLIATHTGVSEGATASENQGGTAVLDLWKGTLSTPDLSAFIGEKGADQTSANNGNSYNSPLARVMEVSYDAPTSPTTIKFVNYKIIPHVDGTSVWLPIQSVSTLFSTLRNDYVSYNGQKVYVNHDDVWEPMEVRDPEYAKALFASEERADDAIDFDYGQLRFTCDDLHGYPLGMSEQFQIHNLSTYLQLLGEDGKHIVDGLLSNKTTDYMLACDALGMTLNDGGNTHISFRHMAELAQGEPVAQEYLAAANDPNNPLTAYMQKMGEKPETIEKTTRQATLSQLRKEAYGEETYVKQGDTAVIVLDTLGYPGADEVSVASSFRERLDLAAQDPEVQNVVIDVSNGTGESIGALMFVSSLMKNRDYLCSQNTRTAQTLTKRYAVDRNLDGVFDEQDATVDYSRLRFCVLTSSCTYACANSLASMMREQGVLVMGEQSAGGSCETQRVVTGDGLAYSISSWQARTVNNEDEDIDSGVPVDVDLVEGHGYAGFYNIDVLSQTMNAHYGPTTPALAPAA